MTTDPHIHQGEFCDLHIRPSDAPESVEVEVFSQKRKNGLWVEVPVAKVRSMLAASVPPGSYTRTDEEDWKAHAEKTTAQLHDALDEQAKLIKERDDALRIGQEALNGWREEQEHRAACHDCAQPRPLTADGITDEMVERARKAWYRSAAIGNDLWRDVLTAVIVPTRPEGAEELARLIRDADVGEWDCGALADALLATGRVRVVTEEQP